MRLIWNIFWWKFCTWDIYKICPKIPITVKWDKSNRHFTWRTTYICVIGLYRGSTLCSLRGKNLGFRNKWNELNWRNHIDQIIPKLSAACYMVRQMYHICNNDTLRSIYFAYFHSSASYGIILWGYSSYRRKIFTLQKRKIRIMMGARPRTFSKELFKKLEILTIPSQYIYPMMSILNWKSG